MTRFADIDLPALPPPNVIQPLDYEAVLAGLKTDMKAALAEVLPNWDPTLESDAVVIQLEVWAEEIIRLRTQTNDAAHATMLAHALGPDLDQIGALLGTARLDGESDAAFRVRIQMAWEGLSTAGPEGAYVYHALSADPRVRDVSVASPVPGTVVVSVLATDGDGTAPDDLIAGVEAALSAETVRPLTDTVVVETAQILAYSVEAVLTIAEGPDAAVVIAEATTRLRAAVDAAHVLGGTVSLSALYAALHVEGVISVDLIQPTGAIVAQAHQAPVCAALSVTRGG